MNSAFLRYLAAAGAAAALATACSSGSEPLTRSGPPVTASAATSAPAATTAAPSGSVSPSRAGGGGQRLTVTPATGLAATQTVLVQGSGFSPGESLVVTQCADKGTSTGPGDCDLTGMQGVTADSNGRVKVQFTVHKGPFGANNITCGPAQACLVSVTQASPSPTEEADAPVKFR